METNKLVGPSKSVPNNVTKNGEMAFIHIFIYLTLQRTFKSRCVTFEIKGYLINCINHKLFP